MGLFNRPPVNQDAALIRGQRAARLLADETIAEAFDHLTERAAAEWRNSRAGDVDSRDIAYGQVASLDALRAQLQAWADEATKIQIETERADRRKAAR